MLPILKHRPHDSGLIVKNRAPDAKPEGEESDDDHAVEACAQDIISAVHAKDSKALTSALKALFECIEDSPSEDESYASQNAKAAQDIE